jgi:uncharacterized protein (TIGR02145 family)
MIKKSVLLSALAIAGFAVTSLAQTVPSNVPTNGLVGWWPFNGNANDESGNGNHGTVNGATLTSDRNGEGNKAYSFDGLDDFIDLTSGSSTSLNIIGDISCAFWLNTEQTNYSSIITLGDNTGVDGGFLVNHHTFNTNKLSIWTKENWFWSKTVCNEGKNDFFCITLKSGILNVYKNGVLYENYVNQPSVSSYSGNRFFGQASHGNLSYFKGILDDIAIYNRGLTQEEITALYTSTPPCSNPIATLTPQSDTLFCKQSNVVLQANQGNGFTYEWYKNDQKITGNSNNALTTSEPGIYKVKVIDGACSTFSTSLELQVIDTITWTGNVDTDWHKACNWSPERVPTCCMEVKIPNEANKPTVSGIAHAHSLTIYSSQGAKIKVNDGANLYIETCEGPLLNNDCIVTPTSGFGPDITDVDGNSYKTVYIGTQQWMGENLKTTKYSDGTSISHITDNTLWQNNTSGAWSYYIKNSSFNTKYGKLYNWYAVSKATNGNKNICPAGWHVPSDAEWSVLIDYLEGDLVAGAKMKEIGTTSWYAPNSEATNSSLFTGLPGAYRHNTGPYYPIGYNGNWWSSTEFSTESAWSRNLTNSSGNSTRTNRFKNFGFSVRCLYGESLFQPELGLIKELGCGSAVKNGALIANSSANSVNFIISYSGSNGGYHTGQTVVSTGVTGLTATLQSGTFVYGNGSLKYEITGTPVSGGSASFSLNIGGVTCVLVINVTTPTSGYGANITDVDGNSYKTVYIGTQQWMGENLKTTKYNDGTSILNITDNTQWANNTIGAWSYYANNSSNNSLYGKLYNWFAVNKTTNGNKNICPTDWHVPTQAEWMILTNYIGPSPSYYLKAISTWLDNGNGSNSSLFNGVGSGYRTHLGDFLHQGQEGSYWSSTEAGSNWAIRLRFNSISSEVQNLDLLKRFGFSIRCVKD